MATAALFGAEYIFDNEDFIPEIGASITIGQKGNTLLDAAIVEFNPEAYIFEMAIKTVNESLGLPVTSGSTLYISDYTEDEGNSYSESNGKINIKDRRGDYIVINIYSYDDWQYDSNDKEVITIEKIPAPLTATGAGEEEIAVMEGDVFTITYEYIEGDLASEVTLTRDGEETPFDPSSLITLDVVQSLVSLIGAFDENGDPIPVDDPLQISLGVDLGFSGGHFYIVEYPDSATEGAQPIYTPFIDKASFDIGIDVSFNLSMDIIKKVMDLIDQITSDVIPEPAPVPNPGMPETFAEDDNTTEEPVNPVAAVIFEIIDTIGVRGEVVLAMDFTGAENNNFGADKVSYSIRIPSFAINIVCTGGEFAGEYSVSFDDISSLIPSYDVPPAGGEVTVPSV